MKHSVPIEVPTYKGETKIIIAEKEMPQKIACMAMDIAKHLSMVACAPDGEDSAGRQKYKLLQPYEVAYRACNIAQFMYDEFVQRNWLFEVPLPKTAKEDVE